MRVKEKYELNIIANELQGVASAIWDMSETINALIKHDQRQREKMAIIRKNGNDSDQITAS